MALPTLTPEQRADALKNEVRALIRELVARKVAVTSTLTVFETFAPGRPAAPWFVVGKDVAANVLVEILERRSNRLMVMGASATS